MRLAIRWSLSKHRRNFPLDSLTPRLTRAGRKLRMGAVDIAEVAQAAGYESHAAFAKAFKQQYGLSPIEFRRLGCTSATQLLAKG